MAFPPGEEKFDNFYKDLKETEQKDSVLTPKQQIDRLLRPGSTYRNLNPYEVLQIDPDLPFEEVKKKFRRLSILVHPDKNQDDAERAQGAFAAVKKAYNLLEDEEKRKECYEVVEEARGRTRQNMEEKRKRLQREAKMSGKNVNDIKIDEDDPIKFNQSVSTLTMKIFADLELKRRKSEQKISDETRKKREQELEQQEKRKMEEEFTKNFEESRQGRVNSWLTFKSGGKTVPPPPPQQTLKRPPPPPPSPQTTGPSSQYAQWLKSNESVSKSTLPTITDADQPAEKKKKKEKKFSPMGFRPPKHKPESR